MGEIHSKQIYLYKKLNSINSMDYDENTMQNLSSCQINETKLK